MTTLETIQGILQETLDIDPADVTEETMLESLELDSLDMTELVSNIEDELDVEFGETGQLDTIGQLVAYVDSLQEKE